MKVARKPLQRPHGQVRRLGHESTYLLASVEYVNPVGGEIIGAGGQSAKLGEIPFRKFAFLHSLMLKHLLPGRGRAIRPLEFNLD